MYNRIKAVAYADKWAMARNPQYYNFDLLGGDCTNYVSQCLYAGSGKMNYAPLDGWFYISVNDRSASWTSAEYLGKFLLTNKTAGVYAREVPLSDVETGDVIQLLKSGRRYHSLFVTDAVYPTTLESVRVNAHSIDSYKRKLSSYENYDSFSVLHIEGVL